MSTLYLNRGEAVSIPFAIHDDQGALAGKRVTWTLAHVVGEVPAITKQSNVGSSSAEIVIASNTGTDMLGTIFLTVEDFAALTEQTYAATLWVDSGRGDDACVTPGGSDFVVIVPNVAREATP